MPFINFDAPDPSGSGYVKEAINTDYVLRAFYDASTSENHIHITYVGEISTYFKGSKATDIYQHIQALPNFLEVSSGLGSQAVELVNLNYALHLFYREKDNSEGAEDGEAVLRIDYGMSDEITEYRTTDAPRRAGLTSSGRSIVLRGAQAEAVWKKYQGTAI
jgi:hypothetical protein